MYLDSGIIAKLLVREADSEWFEKNLDGHALWTSELSLAEVRSAVLGRERTGHISVSERRRALARFDTMTETQQVRFYPINRLVVERAAGLLTSCHPEVPLRSLDAIHVATALIQQPGPLCATDRRMRDAAQKIGLPCFPQDISVLANS